MTSLDRDWPNSTVLGGGLVEFVRGIQAAARRRRRRPRRFSGGAGAAGRRRCDELRLVIAPRIAGRGRRLLDGLPSIQLESIRSEMSLTGYLLVDLSRESVTPF